MKRPYKKYVFLLMGISLLLRALVAALTDLGNDEVYYWTYALYPDWSHFDHPPMVGWIINLFTGNLALDTPFMLRLPALVLGTLNTWLIWRLGLLTGNKKTGWYAALLYTGSLYATVLCGTFILPDTPLATFYLASLYFMLRACGCTNNAQEKPSHFLWAGFFAGAAMLSKYTGAFLWLGTLLYLLFYNRKTFKNPWLWAGMFVSLVLVSPVVWWNATHAATGLSFHANRIAFFGRKPQLLSLGREVLGSFLYNNPVQVILLLGSICYYIRLKRTQQTGNRNGSTDHTPSLPLSPALFRMVLFQSVPMVATFLFFSLFRDTLPHWSAPAFFPLWLFTAAVLAKRNTRKPFRWSLGFTAAVLILGTLQIRTGMIPLPKAEAETTSDDPYAELGRHDVTLDMYGWKQLGEAFGRLQQEQETLYALSNGEEGMPPGAAVLATRWFPAAHYDYYVAKPNGTVVKTTGPLDKTHKYQAITQDRGGIQPQEQLYYIASSRYSQTVQGILPLDTVFVYRNKKPVIRYIISKVTH
ncbi:MAG TPA: glycosyltransferase family 39 protein [Bacteroidales bacterium]|jgi:hypothetical protein|nr:glycosyltransferase family 39 protein [Bacteroidales bacterium]